MHVGLLGKALLVSTAAYMIASSVANDRELWEIPEAQARYAELLAYGCTPEQACEIIVKEFS